MLYQLDTTDEDQKELAESWITDGILKPITEAVFVYRNCVWHCGDWLVPVFEMARDCEPGYVEIYGEHMKNHDEDTG